jgi:hypothetical protein
MSNTQLRLRRGTTAEHANFTGAQGELTVDTDKNALVLHDGATQGGIQMARESVVNVLDYGAKGDGVTDDTDEIQAALNAASSSRTALPYYTKPMVDGANKAYRISAPLEITACGLQNITLIVDTAYADVVLHLKGSNYNTYRNITIKTDKEDDPSLTGLAGRAAKEGAYTGIRLDHDGVAVFDNLFEKIAIQRPNIGILFEQGVAGGFTTSNNFNDCSITGFVTALKTAAGTSLSFLTYFNNCYFFNQRSVDTVLYETDNAVTYQTFNHCTFWQDGATKSTLLVSTLRYLQPLIYINEGYWEIDSFELLDNAVSFSSLGLADKDEGESGTSNATLLPHITSADLKNLIPTTDITRWSVGTNWTKDTKTFRGNAVYKVTAGTIARIDLNFDKQDYSTRWTYSFSGWMKTNVADTSYIYLEIRYSDGTSDFQSSPYAKADGKFRLVGAKLTFDIDTTKTVDRLIGYIAPGAATEVYFSSAAICQSTKIPLIAQEDPFNVVSDTALDNIDIVRESDGTSILTGKTITNPYFYQFGELCYITARISWSGVTGTNSSMTRISGLPFFGDSNARGLGMFITAADGDINSFEVINDGTGYIFKNGNVIASSAFPTSGLANISIVYRIKY